MAGCPQSEQTRCFFPAGAVIGAIGCVRLAAAGCCFAASAASAAFFFLSASARVATMRASRSSCMARAASASSHGTVVSS